MAYSAAQSASGGAQTLVRGAWISLAVLFVIQALNIADRQLLSILAPHVKKDLQLSDTQLGLLIGPAIGFLYAFMGIPLGHVADKVHRIRLLSACLVLWSIFTSLGGYAQNMWQLALSRIGVSAAEGGGQPIAQSLLPDLFPLSQRAMAIAIFGCSSSAGVFIAFSLGGWLGEHHGWRMALIIAGIPGVILAIIAMLLVREPPRGTLDDKTLVQVSGLSFWEKFKYIFSIDIFRNSMFATALLNIANSIVTAWGPTFLVRTFGSKTSAVGLAFGSGLSILSIACILIGGSLIGAIGHSKLSKSIRVVALLQMTGMAFAAVGLFPLNLTVSVLALSLVYGVIHFYLPAQGIILQTYVPSSMRGTAAAVGMMLVTLVSHATAPPLVGLLSDKLAPTFGDASLGIAMFVTVPTIALSAWLYFHIAKQIERDNAAKAAAAAA